MFTLLHISDLHRSPQEPIENAQLLAALLSDKDRYLVETPRVGEPDAAVVSGDIIQGVRLNAPDFAAELDRQYRVAHDFLVALADRLFDGDRAKVVIVPGNHDVCWNTAFRSMTELVPEEPTLIAFPEMFQASSELRWNWSTRSIFRITDAEAYKLRLDAYWRFLERFYDGARLKHPIDRHRGFNLFELDNGRIVVAAFESVHGNDCFCRQGAIERTVLGNCALAIRDLPQQPILKVAAWHHSFQGPPQGDDYMDISSVHEMVGSGFRLGFHGHQHQADASAYAIHLPEEYSMAISSTGSLCAGARELPRGTNREYNLVVIDDKYSSARVHVREMTQGNQFGKCGRGAFRMDGFLELVWQLPAAVAGGAPANGLQFRNQIVLRAEDLLHGGRPAEALELLEGIDGALPAHARHLFVDAAKGIGEYRKIIDFLARPQSIAEFVELFGALVHEGEFELAAAFLGRAKEYKVDDPTVAGLSANLQMRILLGKK